MKTKTPFLPKFLFVLSLLFLSTWVEAQINTPFVNQNILLNYTGIGTNSPDYQLHVHDAGSNYAYLKLSNNTSGNSTTSGAVVGTFEQDFYLIDWEADGNIRFWNNDGSGATEKMIITSAGNVGIGTPAPTSNLQVRGNLNPNMLLTNNLGSLQLALADCNGCFSSVANEGDAVARILGPNNAAGIGKSLVFDMGGTGNDGRSVRFASPAGQHMIINDSGNVGIGVDDPQNKLEVCGLVRAEEILVEDILGCDFVFEDNYYLRSLEEVEKFIDENNRLPEIPPAAEVEKEGMRLGDFQSKMWMKVEELTLYMIEANKQIKHLQQENQNLKNELADLKK